MAVQDVMVKNIAANPVLSRLQDNPARQPFQQVVMSDPAFPAAPQPLRWYLGRFSRKVPHPKLEPSPLRRGRDPNAERTRAAPASDPRFDFTRDRPGRDAI